MASLGCLMWKVTSQSGRSSNATLSASSTSTSLRFRPLKDKFYLSVGIDRTTKFAVTQLVEKADRKTAWEFLQFMLEAVPYQVHTILTDNGIQFAEQPRNRNTHIPGQCAST